MKVATSILSIKDKEEDIKKLKDTSTDYIHLDVMDGIFVDNKTSFLDKKDMILSLNKKLDIHLMVEDIKSYIEEYKSFYPEYMTFHIESNASMEVIEKIKTFSKVGIAINPDTKIDSIIPFLDKIDLVLVMSVNPGYGGQSFMDITPKIKELEKLKCKYSFVIEVDGGINIDTVPLVSSCDIVVSGNFITSSSDMEEKINDLRRYAP